MPTYANGSVSPTLHSTLSAIHFICRQRSRILVSSEGGTGLKISKSLCQLGLSSAETGSNYDIFAVQSAIFWREIIKNGIPRIQ